MNFMRRLGKTRAPFAANFSKVRSRTEIDENIWEDLEETLLLADVGLNTTERMINKVRQISREEKITDPEGILIALQKEMKESLETSDRELNQASSPSVWLFVGLNGVGKTTTIGKIANQKKSSGKKSSSRSRRHF